jgi:ketosteroid isomerase-like protein
MMSISVADHIAIQRLMYRYARCADRKDYAGFAEVFCEDAVFDFSGRVVTSLAAIQDMMHALDKYTTTLHQIHNTLYEVDGDTATGQTYCLASHLIQWERETHKIEMGIIYQDRLRRCAGDWLIELRVFKLLWSQTTAVDS